MVELHPEVALGAGMTPEFKIATAFRSSCENGPFRLSFGNAVKYGMGSVGPLLGQSGYLVRRKIPAFAGHTSLKLPARSAREGTAWLYWYGDFSSRYSSE